MLFFVPHPRCWKDESTQINLTKVLKSLSLGYISKNAPLPTQTHLYYDSVSLYASVLSAFWLLFIYSWDLVLLPVTQSRPDGQVEVAPPFTAGWAASWSPQLWANRVTGNRSPARQGRGPGVNSGRKEQQRPRRMRKSASRPHNRSYSF